MPDSCHFSTKVATSWFCACPSY